MDPQTLSFVTRSPLQSRSISAENPTGLPGQGGRAVEGTGAYAARHLGEGWKISPSLTIPAGSTVPIADVQGSGVLQHFWISVRPEWWRTLVIRFHWDGEEAPSVDVPIGDFFGLGWCEYDTLYSKFVVSAPYAALNSYWPMPFKTAARVTLENTSDTDVIVYYYLDYGVGPVADDAMYFHGTWRRSNPVTDGVHEIADLRGAGKYVGTYLAIGVTHPGWWGEGELKFFIDEDGDYPTICGTGTEDFFGGAWDFEVPGSGYTAFSSHYLGLHQIISPDGLYNSQQRFGMYRWHELDPVNFGSRLRVTVQDLGWARENEYLVRRDDIATTAFWYSERPQDAGSAAMTPESLLVTSHPKRTVH